MLQVETQLPFLIWSVGKYRWLRKTFSLQQDGADFAWIVESNIGIKLQIQVMDLYSVWSEGPIHSPSQDGINGCMLKFVLAAETS
jgi:hypothetical protein